MSTNFAYKNLRGAGRGLPATASLPVEDWDEMPIANQASSLHQLASTDRLQRSSIAVQLTRTPVKQGVPKSYVGVSTDDETDHEEQMYSENQQQRRESGGFGSRASSPVPAFQRNSKVYKSFGGFGSKPIVRPAPPRGIMRTPKPLTATQDAQATTGREDPVWDYEMIKYRPKAPTPRRRFHSGDRPQSGSGGSPPKKQNDQSFFSKLRQGLDFGASFSSRRSSRQQPESLARMPQPGSSSSEWRAPPLGVSAFRVSLPMSDRPRIVGGFGRGFPTRPI